MDKPTIFFSHSSKDRDLILPIKNKILDITGKTMEVFMSSDGQSIPLGRNWVSKIEEGLDNAQIMFIFVTQNSIKSDWIYFEAGYAYSKGIEVIPVGIGVQIGELKAPLNLLQGFDILSHDSMNNFISVINRKFTLSFKEDFDEQDYLSINRMIFGKEVDFEFSKVFEKGKYQCYSQYLSKDDDDIIRYDVEKFYVDIKEYLDINKFKYSFRNKELLVNGIKIEVSGEEKEPKDGRIEQNHKICFHLSTYNFKKTFELFINLFDIMGQKDAVSISLEFSDDYCCLLKEEQLSSKISSSDAFSYLTNNTKVFKYMEKINWWVFDKNRFTSNKNISYVLGFSFMKNIVDINDVIDFMNCLYKIGVIYKK